MKKIQKLQIHLTLVLTLTLTLAVTAQALLTDIDNNKYEESIRSLNNIGVIEGYEDGTFKPDKTINRAELLKIVFKALNDEIETQEGNCFPDVNDEWFAPYVCQAKERGIIEGYPDGTYKPDQEVNMVEAMKIAFKAFDMPIIDQAENEEWFTPYIDFADTNNIFSRFAYLPDDKAKRGEIAFLANQLLEIQKGNIELKEERITKSIGCGLDQPATNPESYTIRGIQRSAIFILPTNYDKNTPYSLIFAFHGRTNSNQMVRQYYGLEKPSANQAIIVYPAGLQASTGYTWSDPSDPSSSLRDYEFYDEMYNEITNNYCVNIDRVYAVGHSLGGWFVNSLACARADTLRAVGTLGGSRSESECEGPVAVMQWHNPNDRLASFESGEAARDNYLEQNKCSLETESVEPYWGNCVRYSGCYEGNPVVWCPHTNDYDSRGTYYPHNWPKGTGEEIWNFFTELQK